MEDYKQPDVIEWDWFTDRDGTTYATPYSELMPGYEIKILKFNSDIYGSYNYRVWIAIKDMDFFFIPGSIEVWMIRQDGGKTIVISNQFKSTLTVIKIANGLIRTRLGVKHDNNAA